MLQLDFLLNNLMLRYLQAMEEFSDNSSSDDSDSDDSLELNLPPFLYDLNESSSDDSSSDDSSSDNGSNSSDEYDNNSPLCEAIKNGDMNEVKDLIVSGLCQIDVPNIFDAPLHLAIIKDRLEIVELLLSHGANIHLLNAMGHTPLHSACLRSNSKIVQILLENKADVNFQTRNGRLAPAHLCPDDDCLKLLLLYGANENLKTKHGSTVLDTLKGVHKKSCLAFIKEVKEMKNIKLNNSNTLHDFMFMDTNKLACYVENDVLKDICGVRAKYSKRFYHYGSMIREKYQKGMDKRNLLHNAKESLKAMTTRLPDLCYEKVFFYLDNDDLSNLCETKRLIYGETEPEYGGLRRSKRIQKRKAAIDASKKDIKRHCMLFN